MEHLYRSDCHTHSTCSPDGSDPAADMLARAEELGLYAYALTDHCECHKFETRYRPRVRLAWDEMERAAQAFSGKTRFYRGIELGQPTQDLKAAREALDGRNYDVVIGSLHNLAGEKDFYHLGQETVSPERWDSLFSQYFEELLQMIRWGNFDTLAHITYPLRYRTAPGENPGFESHWEELEAVLSALIRAGKALEMNTSRLLRKDAPPMPELEVFTCYRELGGRLVTLGSDAHSAENLGSGIDEGMELLKQAGFTEFAVYEKRVPVMLPLE